MASAGKGAGRPPGCCWRPVNGPYLDVPSDLDVLPAAEPSAQPRGGSSGRFRALPQHFTVKARGE